MQIITIAIGLILVFLILSMVTSAIKETIAGWLNFRGKFLCETLQGMLRNPAIKGEVQEVDDKLFDAFCEHVRYETSMTRRGKTEHPSYLKPATFSSILVDILDGDGTQELSQAINALAPGRLKTMLSKMLKQGEQDVNKFKEQLEDWYQDVMDRVSGEYKRQANNIILIVGALVGLVFNADTLAMYHKMSTSSTDVEQVAQIMQVAQGIVDQGAPDFTAQLNAAQAARQQLEAIPDSTITFSQDSSMLAQHELLFDQAKTLVDELNSVSSPLGLGWTETEWETLKSGGVLAWLSKILGLFITAMAISLGAPFWFDLLKRFMNIRNAGVDHSSSTS